VNGDIKMNNLAKFVVEQCIRGDCICRECIDASEKFQPNGHSVDVHFFKVVMRKSELTSADKEIIKNNFIILIKNHKGIYKDIDIFNGGEYDFIEIGAWIGDQGIALTFMAMGELLGIWNVITPDRVASDLSEETKDMLAKAGFISIQYKTT
jgi:hypothetical protein